MRVLALLREQLETAGRVRDLAERYREGEKRARADAEAQRKELRTLSKEVHGLTKELTQLRRARAEQAGVDEARYRRLRDILQLVYDDEPGNRRRLAELRASPDYEPAYSEPDPLVSILIPTYRNVDGLVERAVPSALGQTYRNVEVVVVGDGAGPETADALARLDDPRLRFFNRERRGPYPQDPMLMRFVKGVPPYNEAARRARGRWIAPFADDDRLVPEHVETLLGAARAGRYEACYGQRREFSLDGTSKLYGYFPPELDGRAISWQAGIYHAGLRFIEQELSDALFQTANDKSMTRRMLRCGVRFGFVEHPVVDYYQARVFARDVDRRTGLPLDPGTG